MTDTTSTITAADALAAARQRQERIAAAMNDLRARINEASVATVAAAPAVDQDKAIADAVIAGAPIPPSAEQLRAQQMQDIDGMRSTLASLEREYAAAGADVDQISDEAAREFVEANAGKLAALGKRRIALLDDWDKINADAKALSLEMSKRGLDSTMLPTVPGTFESSQDSTGSALWYLRKEAEAFVLRFDR
jgi:ATP-dependent protease HslVU (ClpYQ) ATPase subunit